MDFGFLWHVWLPDTTQTTTTTYNFLDLKKVLFFTAIDQHSNGLDSRPSLSPWWPRMLNWVIFPKLLWESFLDSFSKGLPGFRLPLAPLTGPKMCEQSRSWGTGIARFLLSSLAATHTGPTLWLWFRFAALLKSKCSSSLWIHTLFYLKSSAQLPLPSGSQLPSFL